jgi:hypothetical protein
MEELILPPSAPAMLNSLRAIGYSFEAALADIVDNSLAAGAGNVDIQFRTSPEGTVKANEYSSFRASNPTERVGDSRAKTMMPYRATLRQKPV